MIRRQSLESEHAFQPRDNSAHRRLRQRTLSREQLHPRSRQSVVSKASLVLPFIGQAKQSLLNSRLAQVSMAPQLLPYFVLSRPGSSDRMSQDAYFCKMLAQGLQAYGVIDGHGKQGRRIALYVAQKLPAFLQKYLMGATLSKKTLTEIVKMAIASTEQSLFCSQLQTEEAGCVLNLCLKWQKHIICANVGDARACLLTESGRLVISTFLSEQHRPACKKQRDRINEAGGRVGLGPNSRRSAQLRVWLASQWRPGLAVTRSIGDKTGKRAGVVSVPELSTTRLTNVDKWLVIASDGYWDAARLDFGDSVQGADRPEQVAARLFEESGGGPRDDTTILVVQLGGDGGNVR